MKHITKLVVALTVASLLLIGPGASAITSVNTSLKLTASKTQVQKGGKVTFTIVLKSPKAKCIKGMPIRWYRNGVFKKIYTTNNNGKVQFKKGVKATSKYFAKFAGAKVGTHPNRLNCQPSVSNTVKITVKK
jgi:hypothetical protein